jgi:hypothetical protein
MRMLAAVIVVTDLYPLTIAWRANRHTTLRHALFWTLATWLAWAALSWSDMLEVDSEWSRYAALCLIGCAGVAVLGARRPGVVAWHCVVIGLLAVLLLPLAEGLGERRLRGPHLAFLAATLAVPLLNYLPTTLAPAVLVGAAGCGLEVARLAGVDMGERLEVAGRCVLALTPWVALAAAWARPPGATEFDRLWLAYRDRFGLVWGQRMREQFNSAAAHAGWPLFLYWRGLRIVPGAGVPDLAKARTTLGGVLKRFQAQ